MEGLKVAGKQPKRSRLWLNRLGVKTLYIEPGRLLRTQYHSLLLLAQLRYRSEYLPKGNLQQADPWLIALVLDRRSQITMFSQEIAVVSQENILSTCKIPAVCKHYKIEHYDLFQFFDKNGWKIGFQKT